MCAPKTMVKIGLVIVAALGIGWFAFPEFRVRLVALAPFALVAICPLAMLLGMGGMRRAGCHDDHGTQGNRCGDEPSNHTTKKADQ